MDTGQRRWRAVTAPLAVAMTVAATVLLGFGTAGLATAATPNSIHAYTAGPQAPGVNEQGQLYLAMRKLMGDHMHWTYATVDAFFNEPKELNGKLTRLLANQTDIGNAIKPYYGDAAGDELSTLLHAHINGYVPLLKDVKAGDSAAATKDFNKILANGVQIGKFLEAANPKNWPAPAVENMFTVHNKQTETYALDIFKGNYKQSITDFETALNHMLSMADTLSAGIIAQFPNKFGAPMTTKQRDLYLAMRKLMGDHMHWTYATVDAFFNEPKELNGKLTRLLAN
ncbi:MAG: hypothetical protein ACRDRN_25320, partial [Sciscionella sp.]